MTRLLYIVGGAVGMVLAMAAVVGLNWWVDRIFGMWGSIALSLLFLAAGGGYTGAMLYKYRRR